MATDPLLDRLLGKIPNRDLAGAEPGHVAEAPDLLDAVEYALAGYQFAFRHRPELLVCSGLGRHRLYLDTESDQRPVLFLDRRGMRGTELDERVLYFDVPYTLVYRPLAEAIGKPGPEANAVAVALAFRVGHAPITLRPWLAAADAAALAARFPSPEALVPAVLEAWRLPERTDRALALLSAVGLEVDRLRRRPYDRPDQVALPVSPEALQMHGLPEIAVGWLRDRYGWTAGRERLLPLQVLAIARGINGGLLDKSGIVTAPTSAGKTFLAEARMLSRYFRREGLRGQRRKTVFLVPTREAGREKYERMGTAFGVGPRTANPENRLRVCYADGDFHGDDREIGEGRFDIAIVVNEKFRYFQHSRRFLYGVGEVVFDELELIGDESRGVVLELALTSALTTHSGMTVLGLARPTADLGAVRRAFGDDAFVIRVDKRPIPIQVGLWAEGRVVYRDSNTGRFRTETLPLGYPNPKKALRGLVERFLVRTPAERAAGVKNNLVIASPTKRENLQLAHLLERLLHEDDAVRAAVADNATPEYAVLRLPGLEPTQRREALDVLLPSGIAIHDADLTVDERRLVTDAFRTGEVCVLFSTQTLAFGVNLPAHTIVFIDWGTSPGGPDTVHPPFYTKLAEIWDTWLGRVGRYGEDAHREAYTLYLSLGGRGSGEYEAMRELIAAEPPALATHLERSAGFQEAVLYAIRSIYYALGRYPTWYDIDAFFRAAPSTNKHGGPIASAVLAALRQLGGFDYPPAFRTLFAAVRQHREEGSGPDVPPLAEALAASLPPYRAAKVRGAAAVFDEDHDPLWDLLYDHEFVAAAMVPDDEEPIGEAPTVAEEPPAETGHRIKEAEAVRTARGVRRREGQFELTRLGQIACAHGVSMETCTRFLAWLRAHRGEPRVWDLADLIVLAWGTWDGLTLDRVRVVARGRKSIPGLLDAYLDRRARVLGTEWLERTLVRPDEIKNVRWKATLLALAAWRDGVPLYDPAAGDDIETALWLRPDGSSLYRHARSHARLLRVLADIAKALPTGVFPPEEDVEVAVPEGGVLVPYGLDAAAAELAFGMPRDAADLARLGIEGLSRTWALRLRDTVDREPYDPDLPLLDRVRRFSEEDHFPEAFPTPGLAERVKRGVEDRPREALAERFRAEPDLVRRYYEHPFVVASQLEQGRGRYTALRVMHRRVYAVYRRNVVRGQPIEFKEADDVALWVGRGAAEFLAEIGAVRNGQYLGDRFFVDLDPHNDYAMGALKGLAATIRDRVAAHRWTRSVALHWTGGRGFHIIGHFPKDAWRPVDTVRLELLRLLRPLTNDVTIFLEDQPSIIEPHVVIDLSPVKARGVYRNAWSLHANTGDVCLPLAPDELDGFVPEHAALDAVLLRLPSASAEDPGA